jgi:hypothetical protein
MAVVNRRFRCTAWSTDLIYYPFFLENTATWIPAINRTGTESRKISTLRTRLSSPINLAALFTTSEALFAMRSNFKSPDNVASTERLHRTDA